jgi:hypothetical protein
VVSMPERQKPLLRRGGLTNRVYLVTRYKDHGGYIEALTKVDITEQYDALRAEDEQGASDA